MSIHSYSLHFPTETLVVLTMLCRRLSELAQVISLNTKVVEDYYLDNSLPIPSIDINGPSETAIRDANAAAARCTVLSAIHELE